MNNLTFLNGDLPFEEAVCSLKNTINDVEVFRFHFLHHPADEVGPVFREILRSDNCYRIA